MPIISNNTAGFTLIELLIALSISTMIILLAGMTFTQGVRHTRVIAGETKLIEAAAHLTDVLTYEIRPALAVSSPSNNELIITEPDLSTHTIKFTGTEIQLDGTSILQPQVETNYLTFIIIDDTVQLSYELEINIGTSPDMSINPFSATTTITHRN